MIQFRYKFVESTGNYDIRLVTRWPMQAPTILGEAKGIAPNAAALTQAQSDLVGEKSTDVPMLYSAWLDLGEFTP